MVNTDCYCGQEEQTRRCDKREWSCGEICDAMLPCRQHSCPHVCHKVIYAPQLNVFFSITDIIFLQGPCPPCGKQSLQKCLCGIKEEMRSCSRLEFQCDNKCNKPLSCRQHVCQKVLSLYHLLKYRI